MSRNVFNEYIKGICTRIQSYESMQIANSFIGAPGDLIATFVTHTGAAAVLDIDINENGAVVVLYNEFEATEDGFKMIYEENFCGHISSYEIYTSFLIWRVGRKLTKIFNTKETSFL